MIDFIVIAALIVAIAASWLWTLRRIEIKRDAARRNLERSLASAYDQRDAQLERYLAAAVERDDLAEQLRNLRAQRESDDQRLADQRDELSAELDRAHQIGASVIADRAALADRCTSLARRISALETALADSAAGWLSAYQHACELAGRPESPEAMARIDATRQLAAGGGS